MSVGPYKDHRLTEIQTDKQTDIQTDKQKDIYLESLTNLPGYVKGLATDKQTDKLIYRHGMAL